MSRKKKKSRLGLKKKSWKSMTNLGGRRIFASPGGALFLGSPRQKGFLHLGMFAAVNFKDLHLTLRVSSTRYFTLSRFEQTRETVKNQCVAQMLLNLIIVVES